MNPFTERVIQIIKSIPAGKVMTYGQIAKEAGSPRGARQVVRILHTMSAKHKLTVASSDQYQRGNCHSG